MFQWPNDNQAELIAFYGDPGKNEIEQQLVHVTPPFAMFYEGRRVKSLLFHHKAADALLIALRKVWNDCGQDQAKIDALGISKTAGTYNRRRIVGSDKWSNHAFGGAIDINAEQNGFNTGQGTIPPVLVAAFDSVRFRWGGRYKGRTDPMHFEAVYNGMPQPVGLISDETSSGVEFAGYCGEPHENGCVLDAADITEHDEGHGGDAKPSFLRRFWGKITAGIGIGGGGFIGIGTMTSWQVAIVLCTFLLIAVGISITFILWFFGADNVRQWVREQVRQ